MKKLGALVAAVAALGCVGAASAADMPVKAPIMNAPAVVPFSWTGFYVGGTVGGAWTRSDTSLNVDNSGGLYVPGDIPSINAFGTNSLNGSNFIFGGKLGYNQQWGALVLGLEGDLSYFHFNKTVNVAGNPFPSFAAGNATLSENVSTNWLATVRPRLGYAFDRALLYVTGGLAVANVKFSDNYVGFSPGGAGLEFESSSVSRTKAGWSVGVGADYALTNNWIVSAEYLHVDLGSVSTSGLVTTGNASTAVLNFTTKLKSDIVRAGIAYKF